MASTLPLPIRIAVGLIATGFDRLRTLPEDLPGISVTLAGQAVRASMRIRQELAELANRGDEMLSPIVDRPEEHPAWARFDDEEGAPRGATDETDAVHSTDGPAVTPAVAGPGLGGARPGPAALSGYDELRPAQVRARLGALTADDVAAVLDYEHAHRGRAAFVTLLENRLATLHAGGDGTAAQVPHRTARRDTPA